MSRRALVLRPAGQSTGGRGGRLDPRGLRQVRRPTPEWARLSRCRLYGGASCFLDEMATVRLGRTLRCDSHESVGPIEFLRNVGS